MLIWWQAILQNVRQLRSHQHIGVCRFLHLTACYGDDSVKIHLTGQHQTTDEDNCRWIYSPNHFATVDRIEVIDLHAYISGRARTVEHGCLYILSLRECCGLLCGTNTQRDGCHLRQCSKTCLESSFIALKLHFKVSSQRHVTQGRNEDWLRRRSGGSNNSVGQLIDISKQSGLQQQWFHCIPVQRCYIVFAIIMKALLMVSLHFHIEHFTPFTTKYLLHSATHWRSTTHLLG